jgi:hypothetical protein
MSKELLAQNNVNIEYKSLQALKTTAILEYLWNVGKLLPDYMAEDRRQSSSIIILFYGCET